MEPKELLGYEKEMLGVYISGHPLDKIKDLIEKYTNITTLNMLKMNEDLEEFGESKEYKDGQNVKFAGIISKVTKKFTRKNTTMAFVSVEDYFGTAEIVVFDSIYEKASSILLEDNIVLIEGRLSIREDEPVKIVAGSIKEFNEEEIVKNSNAKQIKKVNTLNINITNLEEEQKSKLRGAIKFFTGDRVNMKVEITENEVIKPCGAIFLNDKILDVFKRLVGEENVKLV